MEKRSKWTSRKWWAAIICAVGNLIAFAGFDVEVQEAALVDGIIALIIIVEGVIDAVKKS